MIPARLLAVVLWYAGFAPSPRIEDSITAAITYYPRRHQAPKRSARAASTAGRVTGGVHSDDQKYA